MRVRVRVRETVRVRERVRVVVRVVVRVASATSGGGVRLGLLYDRVARRAWLGSGSGSG